MAKRTDKKPPLVIVESPAKAKTIGRFLGSGYLIEASIGHVRDLPSSAAEIPEAVRKEPWARLGIDIEHEFAPLYVVPREKREQIRKLKALLKQAGSLLLATDEDREGESISWHLLQELKPKVPVKRLVFHEITKAAIEAAIANPRDVDTQLVEAQEARRIVDRLYGYSVSPLLWRKIRPRLSAGRVQSVAVRLVVEREQERLRFRRAGYWDAKGRFVAAGNGFDAQLVEVGGRRVATGKDFDPATGKLSGEGGERPTHLQEADARALVARLEGKPARVDSLEQKPFTERPAAPFTTSTLQQEAARKLRFTAQRTMRAAQRLYETGYVTYMRTDSTTLSNEAISGSRGAIATEFGREHVLDAPRTYATKVRNAQEAHEAIRPAGSVFRHPREVEGELGEDERRVYDLVWRRTIASQMDDARGQRTTVRLAVEDAVFQATGKVVERPGFRLAYVEDDAEDVDAAARETERVLPPLREGQALDVESLTPEGHETQPPPRLTEAGLIKELEARGIGRPSTYASIIETILARDYCFKKGTALVPTFTAFAVVALLDRHLHHLVDYEFTAKMEEELDEISNGRETRLDYLSAFYHGNGKPGLKAQLKKAEDEAVPQEICRIDGLDVPKGVQVRVGRYGPFLATKDVRVTLPDDLPPDELTKERVLELLARGAEPPRTLGKHPVTGQDVFVKVGRFGPYVQLGTAEEAEATPKKGKTRGKGGKPKMASLLKGMTPDTLTLETAVALLGLPRVVGRAVPEGATEEAEILAANGRFGPYLRWAAETRSIPAAESPLSITPERALEILRQPRAARGGGGRSAAKVLKDLGKHPKSGADIRLLDGRYGPYVTDGVTNATVPKDRAPDSVTIEDAVALIDARAARGPAKRGRRPARRS
ncbi:MAG TPA: type I DNA topoisomerase [Planctomycetota bacterium]|nr:type I DNA topoisomerase [Planctomycetota bacterium]